MSDQGSEGNQAEGVGDRGCQVPSEEVTFEQGPESNGKSGCKRVAGTVLQAEGVTGAQAGWWEVGMCGDLLGQSGAEEVMGEGAR